MSLQTRLEKDGLTITISGQVVTAASAEFVKIGNTKNLSGLFQLAAKFKLPRKSQHFVGSDRNPGVELRDRGTVTVKWNPQTGDVLGNKSELELEGTLSKVSGMIQVQANLPVVKGIPSDDFVDNDPHYQEFFKALQHSLKKLRIGYKNGRGKIDFGHLGDLNFEFGNNNTQFFTGLNVSAGNGSTLKTAQGMLAYVDALYKASEIGKRGQ